MKTRETAVAIGALVACLSAQADAGAVKCSLRFDLQGWSAFYKSATGTGTVTCDNGQSARVTIRSKGGGLTVGRSKISNGHGTFSDVSSINEVFGTYAAGEAGAGAVKAAQAQVMTKGEVSLAVSGTGKGWDLGISFGEFVLKRRK
jgi:hypothetical protein